MARIRFRDFSKGLWLRGFQDEIPDGGARRFKGVHPIRQGGIRSRAGSRNINPNAAIEIEGEVINSIVLFAEEYWVGTESGKLYRWRESGETDLIRSDFDGSRLRFIKAPPQPGIDDWLFVSGGGPNAGLRKFSPPQEDNVILDRQWGIPAPPDGFTAERKDPKQKGIVNPANFNLGDFSEWTNLSSTVFTFANSDLDGVTGGLKFTVEPNAIAVVKREVASQHSLQRFNFATDPLLQLTPPVSSDVDYISFRVYVDKPEQLDFIQIALDVDLTNPGLFARDFLVRQIVVQEKGFDPTQAEDARREKVKEFELELISGVSTLATGAGDVPNNIEEELEIIRKETKSLPGRGDAILKRLALKGVKGGGLVPFFGQEFITLAENSWTEVKIPKANFDRVGSQILTEQAIVTGVRISVKTKKVNAETGAEITDDTVIHIDELKMEGGFGTKGEYAYHVTWRDSLTGSRSNPNKTPVFVAHETGEEVDREPILLKNLPIEDVPEGVDEVEIWRTLGDGSVYLLADRVKVADLLTERTLQEVGEFYDFNSDVIGLNPINQMTVGADADTLGTLSNSGLDKVVNFTGDGSLAFEGIIGIEVGEERFIVESVEGATLILDRPIDLSSPLTADDYKLFYREKALGELDPGELTFDNDIPRPTFEEVIGIHEGRVFWIDSVDRRRIYFSAIGRPESLDDFREVSTEGESLLNFAIWDGRLWVFSRSRPYQIDTEEVVLFREFEGVPGAISADSIIPGPQGVLYQAEDGIRIFNGSSSDPIHLQLTPIFEGETVSGIGPFEVVSGAFTRREYIISDGTITLAWDFLLTCWRELGLAFNALFFDAENGILVGAPATSPSKLLSVEEEGEDEDDDTPVEFEVELPLSRVDSAQQGILQRVYLDVTTRGEWLTPTQIIDGEETELPPFSNGSSVEPIRNVIEIAVEEPHYLASLRLEGSLSKRVEVHGIELDVYLPEEK